MLVGNQHVMLLTVRRSGVMGGDATMHLGRRGLKTYSSMHQKGFTFCSKRELQFQELEQDEESVTDRQTDTEHRVRTPEPYKNACRKYLEPGKVSLFLSSCSPRKRFLE
jgi:hypothetical protein